MRQCGRLRPPANPRALLPADARRYPFAVGLPGSAFVVRCLALLVLYFVLALISPKGMGMGDVKFAAPLGLALGWFGWNVWVVGLAAGFIIGGVVSLIALLLRRVTLRGSIPFGPSMLAGALVAILVFAW